MNLVVGQRVVWIYKHSAKCRGQPAQIVRVTAEVIQPGQRRVRIHLVQTAGVRRQRWVKPANLRAVVPGEPIYAYPDSA
jgi:hypothetical protein